MIEAGSLRRLGALVPRAGRRGIALAWALAVLAVAAWTSPAVGISRDESVYFFAAESYAAWWGTLVRSPASALAQIDRSFAVNSEHPPFAKTVFGATHALLSGGLGLDHRAGFRAGAFLFAALLAWLLAAWGWDLAGPGGALLAPALFFLVPRHFYHAHPAVLDLPVTALWLAAVYAYRRSLLARAEGRSPVRAAAAAGLLFGAAAATKHVAWFLVPLLLAHWLAAHWREAGRGPLRARLRAVPLAFPAMLLLGPLVLLALWPWMWHHPLPRLRDYVAFHLHHENYPWLYLGQLLREPPFPILYPFVVTALTVPSASLAAMVGGFAHSAARLVQAARRRVQGVDASLEALLLLNAFFPFALIAWPTVPIFGGVKHWLPAMPFLALLGARAVVAAARLLRPAAPSTAGAALAAAILIPAAWSVAHIHPFGTAAYNDLAGGAAGAASLGMQRQFWGDNMAAVLPELNEHAIQGARVWFQEATWLAVREYQRDGVLRPDLRWANGAEDADISVWHYHQEFRDKEYLTWTAFRTARPVAGVYLDEVPLVQVYARAGAWR